MTKLSLREIYLPLNKLLGFFFYVKIWYLIHPLDFCICFHQTHHNEDLQWVSIQWKFQSALTEKLKIVCNSNNPERIVCYSCLNLLTESLRGTKQQFEKRSHQMCEKLWADTETLFFLKSTLPQATRRINKFYSSGITKEWSGT